MAEPALPPPDPVVPVYPELTGPGLEPGPAEVPAAANAPVAANAPEPAPLKSAQA